MTGDFDGDNISDLAIYEQATGVWCFRLSGSGYGTLVIFAFPFGGPGYVPGM